MHVTMQVSDRVVNNWPCKGANFRTPALGRSLTNFSPLQIGNTTFPSRTHINIQPFIHANCSSICPPNDAPTAPRSPLLIMLNLNAEAAAFPGRGAIFIIYLFAEVVSSSASESRSSLQQLDL